MNKGSIMTGVLGLVVGLVVGFMFANSINKSAVGTIGAQQPAANLPGTQPGLPADHPPLGTSTGEQPQGAPRPEVTEAIEKARTQPQNYEAQMTAGDLYYQIKRFDEASKFYEAANKLKPAESEPMIKAGNAYFDSDKYEQAEKWYLMALEKDPKDLGVRTDLGLSFFLRSPRNVERAIKEYKAALAINPTHEISLQNLAAAYKEIGDKENLEATWEKLKKINPNNPFITKSGEK